MSLLADGHKGRALQWTFEDGRRYPAQKGKLLCPLQGAALVAVRKQRMLKV